MISRSRNTICYDFLIYIFLSSNSRMPSFDGGHAGAEPAGNTRLKYIAVSSNSRMPNSEFGDVGAKPTMVPN